MTNVFPMPTTQAYEGKFQCGGLNCVYQSLVTRLIFDGSACVPSVECRMMSDVSSDWGTYPQAYRLVPLRL